MAQIQKGTTYSTGDQVTATNLNALADAAILLPGAITDQTAKTVPLAADTVLIHSAADTALRKSTLTQLFSNATGIPLTTGVTGILPAANGGTGVNNGANTITIAGNVTHAGAFTQSFTATANTALTLPTTGTLATLAGSEALSNKTITASPISGSTGAFTTLSASGTATVGPNNTGTGLALLQLLGGSGTNGGASVYFGTNGTAYSSIGQSSGILGGTTTDFVIYANNSGQSIKFYAGGSGLVGAISNTGLAVTGSITSTSAFISNGPVTTNGASRVTLDYDSGAAKSRVLGWGATTGTAGTLTLGVLSSNASVLATDIATISSTGLAVTGALSASGTVTTGSGSGETLSAGSLNLGKDIGIADGQGIVTGGARVVTFKTSGNVGIGTSSNGGKLSILSDANGTGLAIIAGSFSANTTSIRLGISSDNLTNGVKITGHTNYSAGNGTEMSFSTCGTSSGTPIERARIDSSGNLLVGTTSALNSSVGLSVQGAQTGGGAGIITGYNSSSSGADNSPVLVLLKGMTTTSSSARFVQFYADSLTTPMGAIVGNGSGNVQFATLSDVREKTNIQSIAGSLDKVLALKPVSFDWISNSEHTPAGFIAQDVKEVFPEFVVDNMANEGSEQRYGLTGGLNNGVTAHLVKALQELNANLVAEIQELRKRMAAVEGK
jgi:hypothetical protein